MRTRSSSPLASPRACWRARPCIRASSELVTDIVSGGPGSELYRVELPDEYVGLSIDELSAKLRGEHRATLLAVTRNGTSMTNPPADFRLEPGDDAVVVAESLGELQPLDPPASLDRWTSACAAGWRWSAARRSGLGRASADALAAEGCDLLIWSRSADRLAATAAELRSAHGVRVESVAADAADPMRRAPLPMPRAPSAPSTSSS